MKEPNLNKPFSTQDASDWQKNAGPPLNAKDFERGNILLSKSHEYPSDNDPALYDSGYFEGDIVTDSVVRE